MQPDPMLPSSCAKAATSAEARFRIDAPIAPSRATRVVSLDERAAAVVRHVADQPWATTRFYSWHNDLETASGNSNGVSGAGPSGDGLRLQTMDGSLARLGDELSGVDATIMVAATDEGAAAAACIGEACTRRGIMTAGLVLSDGIQVATALSALRPHARVLMVPAEEDDLLQLLTALRA